MILQKYREEAIYLFVISIGVGNDIWQRTVRQRKQVLVVIKIRLICVVRRSWEINILDERPRNILVVFYIMWKSLLVRRTVILQ